MRCTTWRRKTMCRSLFKSLESTADVDGLGTLRLLEAIRIAGLTAKIKFIRRPRLNFTD